MQVLLRFCFAAFIAVGVTFLLGCSLPKHYKFSGKTMGTVYSVKLLGDARLNADRLATEIDDLLIAFNKVFSTYDPSSEISQINAYFAANNKPLQLEVSPQFFLQLKYALNIAKKTDGYFDPTIKPLVDLWGFSKNEQQKVPAAHQVKIIQQKIGYDKVRLLKKNERCYIQLPHGFALDFSAIAKGKAVDEVANLLGRYDIKNYLVDIGGEIAVRGQNEKQDFFSVGIASPEMDNNAPSYAAISGVVVFASDERLGIATSGDYLNYFEQDGMRYSHIINPATGYPIRHSLASVTVLADTTEAADALATAFFVMGEKIGMEFAKQQNIAAFFIYKTADDNGKRVFKTSQSPAFTQYQKK